MRVRALAGVVHSQASVCFRGEYQTKCRDGRVDGRLESRRGLISVASASGTPEGVNDKEGGSQSSCPRTRKLHHTRDETQRTASKHGNVNTCSLATHLIDPTSNGSPLRLGLGGDLTPIPKQQELTVHQSHPSGQSGFVLSSNVRVAPSVAHEGVGFLNGFHLICRNQTNLL